MCMHMYSFIFWSKPGGKHAFDSSVVRFVVCFVCTNTWKRINSSTRVFNAFSLCSNLLKLGRERDGESKNFELFD